MQAKDIPDDDFLEVVRHLKNVPRVVREMEYWSDPRGRELRVAVYRSRTVNLNDIARLWDSVPEKVILAKAKTLIRQGRLWGCACGCRGDFELPGE